MRTREQVSPRRWARATGWGCANPGGGGHDCDCANHGGGDGDYVCANPDGDLGFDCVNPGDDCDCDCDLDFDCANPGGDCDCANPCCDSVNLGGGSYSGCCNGDCALSFGSDHLGFVPFFVFLVIHRDMDCSRKLSL